MSAPLALAPPRASAGAPAAPWREFWSGFCANRGAVAGFAVMVTLLLLAVLADFIAPHPPGLTNDAAFLVPPFWQAGGSSTYPLGTDAIGRDILSRLIYGARPAMIVAFAGATLAALAGTLLGLWAGFHGGWVDTFISRIMDVFLAFPVLLFALALAGVIPDSAFGVRGNALRIAVIIFIIGFFNWPYIGRLMRGQTLSLREREFVDAARSLGAKRSYILYREVLPNLVAPILVYSTLLIPTNILFEAALSFLGVSVRPPQPTWGGMLSDATSFYQIDAEFLFPAGLAIFVTVLAFNLLGDGLRDALDPRSR